MNSGIIQKIISAQNNDGQAMIELIEQFNPLISKYSKLLGYVDAPYELQCDFINLIHYITPDGFINRDEKYILHISKNLLIIPI